MSQKTKKNMKKSRKQNLNKKRTKRHLYRKRRQILTLPIANNKGIPLFTIPEKILSQRILINQPNKQSINTSGNYMIKGLRNM